MSSFPSLAGRLLLAMPNISDPRFRQAVILVCAHDADHAMGLRLNEAVGELSMGTLFERLEMGAAPLRPDQPVLAGGPVDRERGFVLHTDDVFEPDTSMATPGGLALSTSRDMLKAMADPVRAPRRSLLALGYAGWDDGQLDEEMRDNVWLTAEADDDLIFGEDLDGKWTRAMARIGADPGRLAVEGGRA